MYYIFLLHRKYLNLSGHRLIFVILFVCVIRYLLELTHSIFHSTQLIAKTHHPHPHHYSISLLLFLCLVGFLKTFSAKMKTENNKKIKIIKSRFQCF